MKTSLEPKRILVTGADGQLGATFMELSNGYPHLDFDFKTRADLDITDPGDLESAFSEGSYTYCINCAAYTNVEEAERNPEVNYQVNSEAVQDLAHKCKKNNIVLVHISTDYVFDGQKTVPYTVNDIPNPINEYGKSKWEGEQYVNQILPEHYIVRTSWLYSRKFGHNFYRTVLSKMGQGEELTITDGQMGCPTDAAHLVDFVLNELIKKRMPFGTYHFTNGVAMTWYGFALRILEENGMANLKGRIKKGEYPTLAKRPKYSVLG